MVYCENCGNKMKDNSIICDACGEVVRIQSFNQRPVKPGEMNQRFVNKSNNRNKEHPDKVFIANGGNWIRNIIFVKVNKKSKSIKNRNVKYTFCNIVLCFFRI